MNKLINKFQVAAHSKDLAIIEGVQALKHAVRFNAEFEYIVTCDQSKLRYLMSILASDVSKELSTKVLEVDEDVFRKLSPRNHRTKVVALASRKVYELKDIPANKPIVFLEDPKDVENIGAVIRVAAAANVGAVVTDALASVWHPAVIRGAAGLQYAVPVLNAPLSDISHNRKFIALDPTGVEFDTVTIAPNSVLIFGTERHGISKELLLKSDEILRLPMKAGVSSLNLATSVAATLYRMP